MKFVRATTAEAAVGNYYPAGIPAAVAEVGSSSAGLAEGSPAGNLAAVAGPGSNSVDLVEGFPAGNPVAEDFPAEVGAPSTAAVVVAGIAALAGVAAYLGTARTGHCHRPFRVQPEAYSLRETCSHWSFH